MVAYQIGETQHISIVEPEALDSPSLTIHNRDRIAVRSDVQHKWRRGGRVVLPNQILCRDARTECNFVLSAEISDDILAVAQVKQVGIVLQTAQHHVVPDTAIERGRQTGPVQNPVRHDHLRYPLCPVPRAIGVRPGAIVAVADNPAALVVEHLLPGIYGTIGKAEILNRALARHHLNRIALGADLDVQYLTLLIPLHEVGIRIREQSLVRPRRATVQTDYLHRQGQHLRRDAGTKFNRVVAFYARHC